MAAVYSRQRRCPVRFGRGDKIDSSLIPSLREHEKTEGKRCDVM